MRAKSETFFYSIKRVFRKLRVILKRNKEHTVGKLTAETMNTIELPLCSLTLIRLKEEDIVILLFGGPVVLLLRSVQNRNGTISAHNQEPICTIHGSSAIENKSTGKRHLNYEHLLWAPYIILLSIY